MFNKLWNFFFPSERHREPPPLPRPRKYPRTTDSIPPLYHVKTDMRPNVRRVQGNDRGIIHHNICHPWRSFNSRLSPFLSQTSPCIIIIILTPVRSYPNNLYANTSHVSAAHAWPGSHPSGYPSFLAVGENNWMPNLQQFQSQSQLAPIRGPFAPPPYPPPGYPGPLPSAPLPLQVAPNSTHTGLVSGPTNSVEPPVPRDHSDLSALDWPIGSVRRECVQGQEGRKWKNNKWVWRSNGLVVHKGHSAEVRACLGVFKCGGCGRLTRPKTQPAARQAQLKNGCTSHTCSLEAPLVHDECEARSFHYKINRDGETILVWEHFGDHSTHERPPGGALSKSQEDQIDLQVLRKQEAGAHGLRTGDTAAGSVPFADIAPCLANSKAARYAQGRRQTRLGITTTSLKGGLATISAIGDLQTRLPTTFIVVSSLNGPAYITLQTPFMDEPGDGFELRKILCRGLRISIDDFW
ncbi:hypothetical protein B0H13DRAFT_1935870 [Mycena leptocephala]|nr:hypothetical protein B0H13DRAFT_1935870 [Mycena leptocephala]